MTTVTDVDGEEYLTIEEAAEKYKTSHDTIRRRIREKKLVASKAFGKILIRIEDIEKLIKKTPAA